MATLNFSGTYEAIKSPAFPYEFTVTQDRMSTHYKYRKRGGDWLPWLCSRGDSTVAFGTIRRALEASAPDQAISKSYLSEAIALHYAELRQALDAETQK